MAGVGNGDYHNTPSPRLILLSLSWSPPPSLSITPFCNTHEPSPPTYDRPSLRFYTLFSAISPLVALNWRNAEGMKSQGAWTLLRSRLLVLFGYDFCSPTI